MGVGFVIIRRRIRKSTYTKKVNETQEKLIYVFLLIIFHSLWSVSSERNWWCVYTYPCLGPFFACCVCVLWMNVVKSRKRNIYPYRLGVPHYLVPQKLWHFGQFLAFSPTINLFQLLVQWKLKWKFFTFFLFSPLSICFVADYFTVDGAT